MTKTVQELFEKTEAKLIKAGHIKMCSWCGDLPRRKGSIFCVRDCADLAEEVDRLMDENRD